MSWLTPVPDPCDRGRVWLRIVFFFVVMSISNVCYYRRRTCVKRLFETITFMKDLRCLSVAVFICNSFNSTLSGNSDVARLVAEVEADN